MSPEVAHTTGSQAHQRPARLKAAVIGAGMLGIDLAHRISASSSLTCSLVVGGRNSVTGLRVAAEMGCATSTSGMDAVADADVDVVFDASNASAHPSHWADLASTGVLLLDLTPSSGGTMVAPTVNGHLAESGRHLSLVSCGGQAVLPVLDVVARHCGPKALQYIEVVTTAASASVGRASRLNLDEYIAITQYAVQKLTRDSLAMGGAVKVLANLSPALPAPAFRAEVAVVVSGVDLDALRADLEAATVAVRAFARGYEVVSCRVDGDMVRVTVAVAAEGGQWLPAYAGNVEIINAAAVLMAERHAAARKT
ncbi:acetaldehyde dehydrogenase [Actinomadura livida]|uniref:Acetaldehyde dehydrogenase n=1 Tax=Actinomadura livida TaxID=79909 RepID=A0A7W7I7L2_9ACTN|nr:MULTISPECIES: acetaldehyde dehydrogenase [Actinomadura]MBB4771913.1 acetaldehyde dehydrogenase [Actinomadura catellatispora]GGU03349.1 acetaldehyde dehydrogenase [Actinomadura livida]